MPSRPQKASPSTAAIDVIHSKSGVVISAKASTSRLLNASTNRLTVSTFSLRHRLPPILGEAFVHSAGPGRCRYRSCYARSSRLAAPLSDSVAKLNGTAAPHDMRPLHDHSERAFVAQITNLLGRPLDAVVGAAPVLKEASHGCPCPRRRPFPRRCVPDSVGQRRSSGLPRVSSASTLLRASSTRPAVVDSLGIS